MATVKGSYGRLSYVAETVWGTTPEIPDAAVPAVLDSEVLSSELLNIPDFSHSMAVWRYGQTQIQSHCAS